MTHMKWNDLCAALLDVNDRNGLKEMREILRCTVWAVGRLRTMVCYRRGYRIGLHVGASMRAKPCLKEIRNNCQRFLCHINGFGMTRKDGCLLEMLEYR